MERTIQEQEFFELYETESDVLFRFVLFRVSNREVAQDIVQETFAKYWEVLVSEKPIEYGRALLFRIASHKVIDWYRKKKEYSLDQLMASGFDTSRLEAVSIEARLDMEEALRILRTLPRKYQEVVWLRGVEEWSVQDIAAQVGESVNVVSVRIHRGIRLWRERVGSLQAMRKKNKV